MIPKSELWCIEVCEGATVSEARSERARELLMGLGDEEMRELELELEQSVFRVQMTKGFVRTGAMCCGGFTKDFPTLPDRGGLDCMTPTRTHGLTSSENFLYTSF